MAQPTTFNFRDVTRRLGIEPTKQNHWAVGQILSRAAVSHGVPIYRPLTEKTAEAPTVGAKHCIAAYPVEFFDRALSIVRDRFTAGRDQGDLFDEGSHV
jgi:hypothetical protein